MKKLIICIATAVLVLISVAAPSVAEEADVALKGKVHYLDKEDISLAKKMDMAAQEFKKTGKGDVYFIGYAFLSRHEIHQGRYDESSPYVITVDEGKIKRRRAYRAKSGEISSTEEGNEIVGLLMLHAVSGGKTHIADVEMIDLNNTYDFDDIPLFWLGEAENDESFRFLVNAFQSGDDRIRKETLFVISSHVHPKVYEFLYTTALGDYELKVRENAIFWLGSLKDDRSLEDLKEIYQKVDETKLKKQVVFAYQMSDKTEAVKELVRIAKKETDQKIRKEAIFWLGHKASEESAKVLRDVVNDTDEDSKVKESAVFAISQLPTEQSVPMLIDIARTNKNPKVKKQAIFWLGQKDDDAALKFFEEILLKKK
ncbi:MAG: HEAT repeat domain-containing protein [Candidatus Aminicenantes bacterium]|nr:MAG: HEAT repeat domain-containing protein [Candidatus Aminicenantes bacterium]